MLMVATGFQIGMILAIFYLQVTLMLPTKFQFTWPFGSEGEAKNRFSRCGHLGFPIKMILAIFDLQVTPMLLTKFQVNWPFRLGAILKNSFSRWWPSWISNRNDFSYFWSISHPKFQANWLFGSGEEAKNRFSRWPGFLIGTILAVFFYLQVTQMLPTKFQVNWPFGSGEEAKNRLSRWPPSWISNQNDFSYFGSTSHPDASYRISSLSVQRFRRSC